VSSFCAGTVLVFIALGCHQLLFNRLLIPIKKMMHQITAMKPGINTGIINTIVNREANTSNPSFPNPSFPNRFTI